MILYLSMIRETMELITVITLERINADMVKDVPDFICLVILEWTV